MLRADRLRSTNGYVEGELAGDSGLSSNWNRRPSRKWRRGIEQSGLAQCEVTSPVANSRTLVSHEKVTAENRVKNVGAEFTRGLRKFSCRRLKKTSQGKTFRRLTRTLPHPAGPSQPRSLQPPRECCRS